ncbi:MAG: hypothetical protein SNJ64_04550 [Endomicrobiia bacterium]
MNCHKAKKLISKYFDKQIDSTTTNLLFEHINRCSRCKKEFDILNKIYNNLPKKQEPNLNPFFNQKLKTYISNKQNKFFTNQIFKPAGIFFSLATLLFILSFYLIKTVPLKVNILNVLQNNSNNKNILDDDIVMLDLIELVEEINNETYIFKEG